MCHKYDPYWILSDFSLLLTFLCFSSFILENQIFYSLLVCKTSIYNVEAFMTLILHVEEIFLSPCQVIPLRASLISSPSIVFTDCSPTHSHSVFCKRIYLGLALLPTITPIPFFNTNNNKKEWKKLLMIWPPPLLTYCPQFLDFFLKLFEKAIYPQEPPFPPALNNFETFCHLTSFLII